MKMFGINKILNKHSNIIYESNSQSKILISFEDPLNIVTFNINFLNKLQHFMKFTQKEIEIINNSEKISELYVPLNKLPTLFLSLIKNYLPNYNVFSFPIENYYYNIIAEIPNDPNMFNYIDEICRNINICYVLFDNTQNKNFKYLNIKEQNIPKEEKPINEFNNGKLYPKIDKLYSKFYFYKHRYVTFINKNDNDDYLTYKIKEFRNYFRFRWIHMLIPLYINNSPSIIELTKYIWRTFNNTIKLKIDFDDFIRLGLHPFQLLGSTSLILFRKSYAGGEFALNNINFKYKNSVLNWMLNRMDNIAIHAIIFKNMNYRYNYLGTNPIEDLLRQPILFANSEFLNAYNYPYNIGYLNDELKKNTTLEERLDTYARNIVYFQSISDEKIRFINQYLRLI